jgi:uncharacterized membrane protein YbhN (UPF0104 family)
MNRALLRRGATWLGRLIAVVAVVFVIMAVREQWSAISERSLGARVWLAVAALGIGYGAALMLVAEAWHRLICDFTAEALPRRLTLPSYAVSQPAKYVPGNVFQYVGRHAWLARAGVANTPLLKAMSWDVVLLLLAAALFGIAAFLLHPIPVAFLSDALLRTLAIIAAVVLGVAAMALTISPRLRALAGGMRPRAGTVAAVVALLMLFFLLQALVVVALGIGITGRVVPELATVAVVSWMTGYVPLGTPGGLGTREAMLLLLAGPLIGAPDALLLAGLFRLVTIAGDGVCALIGWAIASTSAPDGPAEVHG